MSNSVPSRANQADPIRHHRTADRGRASVLSEHVAEIRRLGRRVVGDVIAIGVHLTECKRLCGHGYWLPWLEHEFGWSEDTAERFIQVSALSNQIPQVAEFRLPLSGLYLLAAPSTPEPAKTEIIERAKAGEALGVTEVKRVVERHKPPSSKPCKAKRAKAADPPPSPSNEVLQQRAAAAERIRALMGRPKPARDDIGPYSTGEAERLRARNEKLEHENHRLARENLALRSEVDKLKHENADLRARLLAPTDHGDSLDIPGFLDRTR